MPTHPILDLHIDSARWRKIPKLKARLEKAAAATLSSLPKKWQFPCTINLLLSTDATIKKLNRDFRGIDKPTNVLSFPQFESLKSLKISPQDLPIYVGDIAIAYQYIVVECQNNNKILINHLTHLMIHGILHLFGYDHILDGEADKMERLEQKVMKQLGLPDPYAFQSGKKKSTPSRND